MLSAILKFLFSAGAFLLKLLGDTIADSTIQHALVVVIVLYCALHGLSKAFRTTVDKDIKAAEAKVAGVKLAVESPFIRAAHAVKGAIAGFAAGLKAPVAPVVAPLAAPKVVSPPPAPPKAA